MQTLRDQYAVTMQIAQSVLSPEEFKLYQRNYFGLAGLGKKETKDSGGLATIKFCNSK